MKKILINAIATKEGGGAVVFEKTVNEMIAQDNNIEWFIIIDEALRAKIKITDRVTILTFPWIKKSLFHLLYFNEIILPRLVINLKIDRFFSVINTLPFRKLSCKTFLHILQAGYFSKEFISLNAKYNNSFKSKVEWAARKHWTFLSLKKSDIIISPTQSLANEIITQLKIDKNKIKVVLPGPGLAEGFVSPKSYYHKNTLKIGYITKYGVQKNFEVLFKAAAELKKQQIDFKLVLTLNQNHTSYHFIKALIDLYNISDIIENHGEISEKEIQTLYLTLDCFVFPSLCESIGFPLLEAMYYALPIIASDINSNRELLGDEGVFFNPHDYIELSHKIILILANLHEQSDLSEYSIERSKLFLWTNSAKNTLMELGCNIN